MMIITEIIIIIIITQIIIIFIIIMLIIETIITIKGKIKEAEKIIGENN